MLDSVKYIEESLIDKGFSADDAKVMAAEVKNREGICYAIAQQHNKSNTLLMLFDWRNSTQGVEFWKAKFKELEEDELENQDA